MSEEKNINQEERFDELYRQSLGSMRIEPAGRVWNRMNRQMLWREVLRFNFSNLPGYTWVIATAVAVVIGIGIYWTVSGDPDVAGTTPEVAVTQPPAAGQNATAQQPVNTYPSEPANPEPGTPETASVAAGTEASAPPQPAATTVREAPVTNQPVEPTPPVSRVTTATTSPLVVKEEEHEWLYSMKGLSADMYLTFRPDFLTPLAVNTPVPGPGPGAVASASRRTPLQQSLSLGVNITPDMVFYNNTSSYFKYDYTFDAGVQYNFGRFYLGSGAGVAWSTDIGTYAISANKNDSIGFYFAVTSVSESQSQPGEMEYHTTTSTVFDTNAYLYDYSARNTYTYLQIPLIVGFKAVSRPAWSLGIETGGFWSCLLQSNEPPPVFYIPEGRVTDIENLTPARRKSSFGITGSVRFEYIFAKQFSLLIAPTFKYHINALEDNEIPGSTQPWSIGLRAGIWYRIDLKK